MTLVSEHIEPDTRERILVVAERLFREIGYQKTTVADIAKVLRMSPANVYRFFDSKKAIHEGVARGLMGEVEEAAQAIAARPRTGGRPPARTHDDHPSHELANAMSAIPSCTRWSRSRWRRAGTSASPIWSGSPRPSASVIAEGVASGEFEAPDVPLAAMCTCTAMMRFFHPQMIAQCANKPGPSLDQMIDFVLAGLAPRGKATGK